MSETPVQAAARAVRETFGEVIRTSARLATYAAVELTGETPSELVTDPTGQSEPAEVVVAPFDRAALAISAACRLLRHAEDVLITGADDDPYAEAVREALRGPVTNLGELDARIQNGEV